MSSVSAHMLKGVLAATTLVALAVTATTHVVAGANGGPHALMRDLAATSALKASDKREHAIREHFAAAIAFSQGAPLEITVISPKGQGTTARSYDLTRTVQFLAFAELFGTARGLVGDAPNKIACTPRKCTLSYDTHNHQVIQLLEATYSKKGFLRAMTWRIW